MIILNITRHSQVYTVQLDGEIAEGAFSSERLTMVKELHYPTDPYAISGYRFVDADGIPQASSKAEALGLANVPTIYHEQEEQIVIAGIGSARIDDGNFITEGENIVLSGLGCIRAFNSETDNPDSIIGSALESYTDGMPDPPDEPVIKIKFSLLENQKPESEEFDGLYSTVVPTDEIEGGRFIGFDGALAENGLSARGILLDNAETGIEAKIKVTGFAYAYAEANLFAGIDLTIGYNGGVIPASSSDAVVARAWEDAASGQNALVLLTP